MINTRLKKTFADFTIRWSQSLLTLAGLTIGISAVIAVSSSFLILSDDLTKNFTRTNPPNVEARLEALNATDIETFSRIPGVAEVEERRSVPVRVELQKDVWFTMLLYVVEDFGNMRIAKIDPEAGAWPAADGDVLVERDGRFFLKADFGTDLKLRFADGEIRTLKYSGQVHDAGQAPSRMERLLYGYITRATYDGWNLEDQVSRVLITVSDAAEPQAEQTAAPLHKAPPPESRADFVADHMTPVADYMGKELYSSTVKDATQHPHAFQMNSIIALLAGLLVTALVLCGALTINLIDSILTAEKKNIGVMKAIGGGRGQILSSYLLGTGALGALAALIGLPFALDFGRSIAQFIAYMINFNLLTETNPVWLAPSMIALGVLVPLLLTWQRVSSTIRKPVNVALRNDDHMRDGGGRLQVAQMISWLPLVPRMALRNLFRTPRRSLLTVLLVVVGLTSYLMAANIRSSLLDTVDAVERSQRSNVQASMRESFNRATMTEYLAQFNEVEDVEFRNRRLSRLLPLGENVGRNQIVNFVTAQTPMLIPDMMKGDWINDDRPSGIVVSNIMYLENDDVEIGSVFDLEVDGMRTTVTVVGVIKEFGGGVIYAPTALSAQLGLSEETANSILLRLRDRSIKSQGRFKRILETRLVDDGWNVFTVSTTSDLEAIVEGHLEIIALVLEIVAAVMLVVCGLGLASAASVNVIERAREIGILKAIGGRSGAIRSMLVWEAVFIALAGWAIAVALAPIPSQAVAAEFGLVLVQYPFNYKAAALGAPIAGAIGVGIAIIASLLPAHAATRNSVRAAIQSV